MRKTSIIITIIIVIGLIFSTSVFAGGQKEGTGAKAKDEMEEPTLVVGIRGLDNPYHADYARGAEALGEELGLEVDVLTSEANSQKQFADLRAEIAKTGGNIVVSIDPNEAPDVVPIAKMLEEAEAYWVNWWNKPGDVHPWDYKYWVFHVGYDAVKQGYWNAIQLFKTFDNEGKIIAIQGMLANNAAIGRFEGLQKALDENPGVELLQWETADWDTTKAYNATKALLSAHPDVDGVWCANDNMAFGAIQALKEEGLAGEVLVCGTDGVPEAFEQIKAGNMCSTSFQDARYQAQFGLMACLAARNGELDVESLPKEKRSWLLNSVNVNQENVDEFVAEYIDQMPEYDLSDFWKEWAGPAF